MATKAIKGYNAFTKGLITEGSFLSSPEGSTRAEDNMDLSLKGNRPRRLGFDYEGSFEWSSFKYGSAGTNGFGLSFHIWKNVEGTGQRNFLVCQSADHLYFYDITTGALSPNEMTGNIDFSDETLTIGYLPGENKVSCVSAKGRLFVCSKGIHPFMVEYDSSTDTFTKTRISLKIRDFTGIDDGVAMETQPTTLPDAHVYNLLNRGWLYLEPNGNHSYSWPATYFTASGGHYPAKTQSPYVGVEDLYSGSTKVDRAFYGARVLKYNFGTSSAAQGYVILDFLAKDRNVPGVVFSGSFAVERREGPVDMCFFSGRLWYLFEDGQVLFSQIINEDYSNVGACYQMADPTSPDDSSIVADDGGHIRIQEAGRLVSIRPYLGFVVVLGSNGTWVVGGTDPGQGFSALSYQVVKSSNFGAINRESVVEAEGFIAWFGETGIYVLTQNPQTFGVSVKDITEQTIKSFYLDIDLSGKQGCVGAFDADKSRIYWLYPDSTDASSPNAPKALDNVLVFDIRLGAFVPWTLSSLDYGSDVRESVPHICYVIQTPSYNSVEIDWEIVTEASEDVIANDGAFIIEDDRVTSLSRTYLRFCCLSERDGVGDHTVTFGDFYKRTFTDWDSEDPCDYSSYLETSYELMGDLSRYKWLPYIHCFFERTETAYTLDGGGSYELLNPSSCYLQARWEWTDHINAGRWSDEQQVYRFNQLYTPSSFAFDNGYPVVVTKTRIRGKGKSLQLRFRSEAGKDFNLLGWSSLFEGNTDV